MAVVTLLRDFSPVLIRDVTARFTGGPVMIAFGVLALLIAALNALGLARRRAPVPTGSRDPAAAAPR
jgi:hypothetical protein